MQCWKSSLSTWISSKFSSHISQWTSSPFIIPQFWTLGTFMVPTNQLILFFFFLQYFAASDRAHMEPQTAVLLSILRLNHHRTTRSNANKDRSRSPKIWRKFKNYCSTSLSNTVSMHAFYWKERNISFSSSRQFTLSLIFSSLRSSVRFQRPQRPISRRWLGAETVLCSPTRELQPR